MKELQKYNDYWGRRAARVFGISEPTLYAKLPASRHDDKVAVPEHEATTK